MSPVVLVLRHILRALIWLSWLEAGLWAVMAGIAAAAGTWPASLDAAIRWSESVCAALVFRLFLNELEGRD